MSEWLWVLWFILGAILIVAEIFTSGFVLLWFGIGALVAALAGFIGIDSLVIQFLIFASISISLTAASRTIFINYFSREKTGQSLRSGVDALPGKIGTVVSSSKGALQEGAVKVFGSTWTAYPAPGEPPLEAGERVCVESVEGASIYVKRVGGEPDWRPKSLTADNTD
jgi:membrane protein implicated in regulation of membrane protease activity